MQVKKLLFLISFLYLLLTVDSTCRTRPTLKYRSGYWKTRSLRDSVKVLQQLLNDKIKAGLKVDGFFGRRTKWKVRVYQSKNGLQVDGIVGPNTWESLCGKNNPTPEPKGMIEPFKCPYGYWPARVYTDRVRKRAFKSGSKTYHELAVEIGKAKQVHPALLATHMVLESSMGINNRCASKGKTILTGCRWYPSCSRNCACSSSSVYSDIKQLQCTADTDRNAANFQGPYAKCSRYRNDPAKSWNCILCIYQGNYYKDIKTDDNDPRYFVKHGTCQYAENFRKQYCDWQAYFAYYENI